MRIGICVNMFQSPEDSTGLGVLPLVKKAGFDYFEAPMAQLLALPADELERQVDAILGSGVPCEVVNNFFQASVRLTGPDVDDGAVDAYIDRAVALAARLGVKIFVFGSAGARNVPMGYSMGAAREQAKAMLRRLGPKAAAVGATVIIEHINRLEGNLIATFQDGINMVGELNLPSVGGFVDYFHLGLGNETLEYLDQKFDAIVHSHFANLLQRSLPVPHRHEPGVVAFLDLMKRKNYGHRVSCEGFSPDPVREIPAAAEFLAAWR